MHKVQFAPRSGANASHSLQHNNWEYLFNNNEKSGKKGKAANTACMHSGNTRVSNWSCFEISGFFIRFPCAAPVSPLPARPIPTLSCDRDRTVSGAEPSPQHSFALDQHSEGDCDANKPRLVHSNPPNFNNGGAIGSHCSVLTVQRISPLWDREGEQNP